MLVYMLKDVEKVGIAGQVVKVAEGFAKNFLIPNGAAKIVNESEKKFLDSLSKNRVVKKEVISSKIGMLADKIENIHVTISKKVHDDGKLYGSISAEDVIDGLKGKEIIINKKQVDISKTIKTLGEHKVTIRLSSKFNPELTIKVIDEKSSIKQKA